MFLQHAGGLKAFPGPLSFGNTPQQEHVALLPRWSSNDVHFVFEVQKLPCRNPIPEKLRDRKALFPNVRIPEFQGIIYFN
jgi:hypothetical protein